MDVHATLFSLVKPDKELFLPPINNIICYGNHFHPLRRTSEVSLTLPVSIRSLCHATVIVNMKKHSAFGEKSINMCYIEHLGKT